MEKTLEQPPTRISTNRPKLDDEQNTLSSASNPINYLGYWVWNPEHPTKITLHDHLSTLCASSTEPTEISLDTYIQRIPDEQEQNAFKRLLNDNNISPKSASFTHGFIDNKTTSKVQVFLSFDKPGLRGTVIDISACTQNTEPSSAHYHAIELEKELINLRELNENEFKERIQAEKNLWESQRKFKTLLSNLPGMAYRCQYNQARNMEFLSKGSHALTGFHSWELVKGSTQAFSELIVAEDIESCWNEIQTATNKKQPYKITYRILKNNNEIRWIQDQGQAVFSENGTEVIALEGFMIDVTDTIQAQKAQQKLNEELELRVAERTQALKSAIDQLTTEVNERRRIESQLRINETRLRNAQHIANLGSWDKDMATQKHSYSDEIFRMLDIDATHIMPSEEIWTPHIHPDDLKRVISERENILSGRHDANTSIEYRIVLHNEEQRFIQERSQITVNDDNEPTNIATTVLDITESKKIQEELIKYREHLQELVEAQTKDIIEARDAALSAERAMSAFIANMSHEIRTPLHGILSFANFGLKKIETASKEKLEGYFQEIHDSGETLLLLLNDLLDLSKLKAGKMVYDYHDADLAQTLHLAAKEFTAMRLEKNISFQIDSLDKLPGKFDKDKVRQVLRNLISNAIKFSPENSNITVTAQETDNDFYDVSIRDQGPGIPEDEVTEIFSPFVQSTKTRSKAGGTGLGLAICKEIIESGHSGLIHANNNPDGGATFFVRISKTPN